MFWWFDVFGVLRFGFGLGFDLGGCMYFGWLEVLVCLCTLWFGLDFGVMFCDLYIVVYCCVPGLCLSVAVCLLVVGGSV